MSERDDYLADPKAPVDPSIAALERALAPLAYRPRPWRVMPPRPRRRALPWLLAAVALLAGGAAWWFAGGERPLEPFAAARTFVAANEALRIPVGDVAEITLRPGSELEFRHWRKDEMLFELRRGGLEARVLPPPKVEAGFFRMATPRGLLVDQGCRYELVVRDDGGAHVFVTEGAVTFAAGDRTIFVPAGAMAEVGSAGPATPTFVDGAIELTRAVRKYDDLLAARAPIDDRATTVKMVLASAREPRDSLALWHLLRDPEPEFRAAAEGALLGLLGPPDGGKVGRGGYDPEEWLPFLRLGAWQGAR